MDYLLRHFISLAISYKEFIVVGNNEGNSVKTLDPNEEYFHCEFINNDLCKIYKISDWRDSIARLELVRAQSELDRQNRFRQEEIINSARKKLMSKPVNPLTEKAANELIANILSGDEMYDGIAEKLGLKELIIKK